MIKVTVVVPAYNKKDTINRCIDSILNQTFQDFEIIVIFQPAENENLDDMTAIIEDYHDPRIKIIAQVKRGVSIARNRGVEMANAELIAFLDADDEWTINFLDLINSLVEKFPKAGAYATAFQYIKNHDIVNLSNPIVKNKFKGPIDYFETAINGPLFCSSSIVFKKDALLKTGGFDTKMWFGEDNDLWARTALKFDIAFDSSVGTYYYLGIPGQATTQLRPIVHHFVDYVNLNLSNPSVNNDKVLTYTNYRLLIFVMIDIANGFPIEARSLLRRRPSNRYFLKIIYCYLLSMIPPKIIKLIRTVLSKIRYSSVADELE
jgi:glycosyltransferase involved in cell wall biosynthesis